MFKQFKKPISFTENDIYNIHHSLYGVTEKRDGILVALINHFHKISVYNYNQELVKEIHTRQNFHFTIYGEMVENQVIYIFDCNLPYDFFKRYSIISRLKIPGCILNKCTFTFTPFHILDENVAEGYILTPSTGNGPIYKYKKEHTVDFAIYNKKCYCMISENQYNDLDADDLTHFIYDKKSDYFLFEFYPCSEFNEDGYEGQVVECILKDNKWYFFRQRPDKTKQLPNQGPNNFKTCLDHYYQYGNKLTLKKILDLLNINGTSKFNKCSKISNRHLDKSCQ